MVIAKIIELKKYGKSLRDMPMDRSGACHVIFTSNGMGCDVHAVPIF